MRAFERLLVALVCLSLTAYLWAQASFSQSQQPIVLDQLYPPTPGIHYYGGPTLKVSSMVLVLKLDQTTMSLVFQALATQYQAILPADASCFAIVESGKTLVGPCYTETKIVRADVENITLTIESPIFQNETVAAGYYKVLYAQPKLIAQNCGGQVALYVNSTQLLLASRACVFVQLVQAQYLAATTGGGLG